ncbi:MAG: ATP synthase F1 subunit delta [Chloroflexi bacterium]|nr:ATP synthase F1 subunit delta [Chloroflexota bacterium]
MATEGMARTYAQAIFEKAVEGWLTPLKAIQSAIAKENLYEKLDDASVAFPQKQAWIKQIMPANTAPEAQNLVALLVSKNEAHLLPGIIAEFESNLQRGPARPTARITSAVEFIAADRKTLEEKLSRQFGAGLEFQYVTDASLLGGVIVRVGDKVIDGSVAGKLAALKEKLTS